MGELVKVVPGHRHVGQAPAVDADAEPVTAARRAARPPGRCAGRCSGTAAARPAGHDLVLLHVPVSGQRDRVGSDPDRGRVTRVPSGPELLGVGGRAVRAQVGLGRADRGRGGDCAGRARQRRRGVLAQQRADVVLGLGVGALAEVRVADVAVAVDQVVGRPVLVAPGVPGAVVVVDRDGVADAVLADGPLARCRRRARRRTRACAPRRSRGRRGGSGHTTPSGTAACGCSSRTSTSRSRPARPCRAEPRSDSGRDPGVLIHLVMPVKSGAGP